MIVLRLCCLVIAVVANPVNEDQDDDIGAVEPDVLEALYQEERFEELSYLMRIDNVELARPGVNENPMFNEGIFGDMILSPNERESARQNIRFERFPGSKWQNGIVPYIISSSFNQTEQDIIEKGILRWNQQIACIRLVPRTTEAEYVWIFPGNGCWSFLGRIGGFQAMSLQRNGCLQQRIILHLFVHTIGISFEHNRSDRDNFVHILWDNIPPRWRFLYYKQNERYFGLLDKYDYYSIMHLPYRAPETDRPAFELLDNTINPDRIGTTQDFTEEDKIKIRLLYCR